MGLSNRISNILKTKMLSTLCIEKAQNPKLLPNKQMKGGEFCSSLLVFIIHAGFTTDANPGQIQIGSFSRRTPVCVGAIQVYNPKTNKRMHRRNKRKLFVFSIQAVIICVSTLQSRSRQKSNPVSQDREPYGKRENQRLDCPEEVEK